MKKTQIALILSIISYNIALGQQEGFEDFIRFVEFAESNEQPDPVAVMEIADNLNDIDVYLITAHVLYKSGEWAEAIHYCNKSIDMKPLYFRGILLRGCAKVKLGLISSGWEDIILTLDPDACRIGCHHEDLDSIQKERLINIAILLADSHYHNALSTVKSKCKSR
jgi:tetratricopeptide (TPR) repeat protein